MTDSSPHDPGTTAPGDASSPTRPTAPQAEVLLFGGSFDPPHVAHLLAGSYLLATRDAELWLLPSAHHPFGKNLGPFAERAAMCQLLAGQLGPRARVEPIEAELGGEGRTIDTVEALQARHPGRRFRLVVGADILGERHQWKRWTDLVRLAPPIYLGRTGYAAPPEVDTEITLPRVSSSEVRRRLAAGEPVSRLVPTAVLRHIEQRGLYRTATPGPASPAAVPAPSDGADSGPPPSRALLGAGRAGLTLALALARAGRPPRWIWERSEERAARARELLGLPVLGGAQPPAELAQADVWLLAVPDGELAALAARLAQLGLARPAGIALHLAGALDTSPLAALAAAGMGVGSCHPLAVLPDLLGLPPAEATVAAATRLRGAAFALAGDDERTRRAAAALAADLGGDPVPLRPGGKAAYHAGAALAAGGLVTLLHEAARTCARGLATPAQALPLMLALARGALSDLAARGAASALTGPLVRGDEATVRLHLNALAGDEARPLYLALARRTLALARQAGTDPTALARLARLLDPCAGEEQPGG